MAKGLSGCEGVTQRTTQYSRHRAYPYVVHEEQGVTEKEPSRTRSAPIFFPTGIACAYTKKYKLPANEGVKFEA